MSSKIEGKKIYLTRGDSFKTTVLLKRRNGDEFVPQDGDVIVFALKSARMTTGNQEFMDKSPLVLKTIPNDTMLLEIDPQDTKSLKFGDYKYDIEVTFANGDVDTPFNDEDFVITPEVY